MNNLEQFERLQMARSVVAEMVPLDVDRVDYVAVGLLNPIKDRLLTEMTDDPNQVISLLRESREYFEAVTGRQASRLAIAATGLTRLTQTLFASAEDTLSQASETEFFPDLETFVAQLDMAIGVAEVAGALTIAQASIYTSPEEEGKRQVHSTNIPPDYHPELIQATTDLAKRQELLLRQDPTGRLLVRTTVDVINERLNIANVDSTRGSVTQWVVIGADFAEAAYDIFYEQSELVVNEH